MIKRFVGCGDERPRVREGCAWGEFCIGKRKGEERLGVRLMGGRVIVLQENSEVRECTLVNGWYQER